MAGQPGNDGCGQNAAARHALIREIKAQVRKFGTGDGEWAIDPKVLAALDKVPREAFVPDMEQALAYANQPLPIDHGQTISQPLIVALMTHHLRVEPSHKILEIGTGSGYQTAVLAEIGDRIVTIENVMPLARAARAILESLRYTTIRFVEGDGGEGFPAEAPFDRIMVTAAAVELPEALIEQLAPEGRLVAPVGRPGAQRLVLITKSGTGEICRRGLFPVAFVPLTSGRNRDGA